MRLIKNSDGYIVPESKYDMPMFQHCANNSIAVTQEYYFGFVEPLLELHGVDIINSFEVDLI